MLSHRLRGTSLLRLLLLALVVVLVPSVAFARSPAPNTGASPDSWVGQLEGLSAWLAAHKEAAACTERCFTLQRLRLTGSLDGASSDGSKRGAGKDGGLHFELEGAVLADHPVAVPLFGPPDKIRLDNVTIDGKPAAIGFEGDHYFVYTASPRFLLKGTLALQDDLALSITGPLNLLEADLASGRVVEGSRLSGLSASTIHLEHAASGTPEPVLAPTVFQLARAVRVGREIGFEYRLTMRSGIDLGVVHLPLKYGERVLDVNGSAGWHVEASDLVLPTAGHDATMVITGTLPQVAAFAPDDRSPFETWLLESDLEHRTTVAGDAKRVDLTQSPFPRWSGAVTSQLFMVPRGQKLDVTVQSLVTTDALAATVRSHSRMVVLTPSGDLVSDDTLAYDNNGVDYVSLWSQGRPIFLATDGRPERMFHREGTIDELLVPLRTGSHALRTQSLSRASVGALGGVLDVATPTHSLATARTTLTFGLPEGVRPIAVLGGDHPRWAFGVRDGAAILASILVALLALRGRGRRVLGAATLTGLWFTSSGAFMATLCVLALGTVAWTVWRLTAAASRRRVMWTSFATVAAGIAMLILMPSASRNARVAAGEVDGRFGMREDDGYMMQQNVAAADLRDQEASNSIGNLDKQVTAKAIAAAPPPAPAQGQAFHNKQDGDLLTMGGNGGVLGGVTPVALALPSFARTVVVDSELVTPERPFRPRVVYITGAAVLGLSIAWLACIALLSWTLRAQAKDLARRLRERLAKPAPAAPVPAE